MFYTIKDKQWYGYDAYDGAFHYFIRTGIQNNRVWLVIDSFSDCSALFWDERDQVGKMLVSWIEEPYRFQVEALKRITNEEFELFFNNVPDSSRFIEIDSTIGNLLFEPAFEREWEAGDLCIHS
ncbi:hypothetical protein [Paenibacillus sp. GYB003]|uniref:hypothetical protein n=1 Tax=Paenibacillus sp. GYB003 TaxID=2994392 RepID=UPI002F96D433